jgi:hypothetical protein
MQIMHSWSFNPSLTLVVDFCRKSHQKNYKVWQTQVRCNATYNKHPKIIYCIIFFPPKVLIVVMTYICLGIHLIQVSCTLMKQMTSSNYRIEMIIFIPKPSITCRLTKLQHLGICITLHVFHIYSCEVHA